MRYGQWRRQGGGQGGHVPPHDKMVPPLQGGHTFERFFGGQMFLDIFSEI